jgi:hypothetical protein
MNSSSTRGFYESTKYAIMNNKDFKYDNSKNEITKTVITLLYKLRQIKEILGLSKLPLNLIYYDENLRDKGNENSDNCTFFQMHLTGTFYGCHNFELFQLVCEQIKKRNKQFILLSSGSAAEKIFDYCSDIKQIREYYIFCFKKEKYEPLLQKYKKLKGVYNLFDDLLDRLFHIEKIPIENMKSSNLIFFEDYNETYIKLHYKIIQRYQLFKLFKENNYNQEKFIQMIAKEKPNFLEIAEELFPDKKEIIEFFKEKIDEKESEIEPYFNCIEEPKTFIRNYTLESFYYFYLNKFLRQGDYDAFIKLSTHISKFVYFLLQHRKKDTNIDDKSDLYRTMTLFKEDINLYESSVGRVFCYPSFTSTSLIRGQFTPTGDKSGKEVVILEIKQNGAKNAISVEEYSKYKGEKEYIFPPFSFFKISGFKRNEGTPKNPHIIQLLSIKMDKPLEETFEDFFIKETDNLDPEGLDMLILCDNNEKIEVNKKYYTSENSSKKLKSKKSRKIK